METREGPRPPVGALILAAGRGSRFGAAPKLLADYRGRPLVRCVAQAALASRARPVVVVLGAHAQRVGRALDGLALTLVENADFAEGLSTSLRAGLAALPEQVEAAVVLLADMPRIEARHVDRLIEAYAEAGRRGGSPPPAAVVPVQDGRRGNPVLLDRRVLADDLAVLAGDRGAGGLLRGRGDVVEIAGDAATGFDVDTPDALSRDAFAAASAQD